MDVLDVLVHGPQNLIAWCLDEDEHALDAWERMTNSGLHVTVIESSAGVPVDPWGVHRFRKPASPGGLRLQSWDPNATR